MADLSPAAQAVLTAATQRLYCLDPEDVPTSASEHGCSIAAALRAAAEGAMRNPGHWNGSMPDDYDCGWNDGVRCLLAIAAELEQSN